MRLGALNWGGFFAVQPDTRAKLAGFAYAFEHLEIGAYELLRRVAQRGRLRDSRRRRAHPARGARGGVAASLAVRRGGRRRARGARRGCTMKAVTFHGKRDVRVENVPDPTIEQPTDAIIRVTSSGLCGSDLHLYEVMGPFMDEGDVLGHQPMGIV
jgi:hypothetical protein